jgi:hypothetical protein
MRSSNLKDRVMPLADYEQFQSTFKNGFAGSFTPKVDLLPAGTVRLTECHIELNPKELMRQSRSFASFDEETYWQIILDFFRRHGFEQAP